MKRTCPICSEEYEVPPFHLDGGCCPKHVNRWMSKPLWFVPCPEGTRSLWRILMTMHFLYFCFFALLLYVELAFAARMYSLAVFLYFGVRLFIGSHRGYPILTKRQTIGLALLPLYGPLLSLAAVYLVQAIKYGR